MSDEEEGTVITIQAWELAFAFWLVQLRDAKTHDEIDRIEADMEENIPEDDPQHGFDPAPSDVAVDLLFGLLYAKREAVNAFEEGQRDGCRFLERAIERDIAEQRKAYEARQAQAGSAQAPKPGPGRTDDSG